MSVVVLNMSQFPYNTFERNWEEFSASFSILNYSGKRLSRVFTVQWFFDNAEKVQ